MPDKVVLRALTGDLRGQEFTLTGPAPWIIGRSRGCSLRVAGDATVSRHHCSIEVDERGVWVQDLGSLNGTLVNGTRISRSNGRDDGNATCLQSPRQALADGDELRICNTAFAVCFRAAEAAPKRKETMRWDSASPEVRHAFAC